MKRISLTVMLLVLMTARSSALLVVSGISVVIDKAVYEDIYISGGTVLIDGPVYGSLIVAGGTVSVRDSVMHDILLIGGDLTIDGYVGGSVRCAGGKMQIASQISHDLVAAGGAVLLDKNAGIGGEVLAFGGDFIVNGVVNGNITLRAGSFQLNGTAHKDLACRASYIALNGIVEGRSTLAASEGIDIGDSASLSGEIRYWTKDKVLSPGHTFKSGAAVYDPTLEIRGNHWYYFGAQSIAGVLWYLGMALVMIFIMQYFFEGAFLKAGDQAYLHPWKSLFLGIQFVLLIPFLIILCFLSLVGIPLGLILLAVYTLALLFSGSITALVLAHWLNERTGKHWKPAHLCLAGISIFILLKLVAATPFLGWALSIVLTCFAFGSLLQNVRWKRLRNSPAS